MHFQYCPHCGKKAERKQIGDEGLIPYCTQCEVPLWDMFTTSIIAAVVNECGEIALLRQNYVSQTNHVCVAGIMKLGESAEETVIREVGEELGLKVKSVEFVKSYPYEKKEMLMLGFRAVAEKADFVLSGEVDAAEWVKLEDAPGLLREGSIAWQLVRAVKVIFDDHTLCSQFLRDYVDLPYMKGIRPEDIEDVSEQYVTLFAEERNSDRVKRVHVGGGSAPFFLVSLIEHKTAPDYNVCMQVFRYMVYIWETYEKEAESIQKGMAKREDFLYPPILPIIYYEGAKSWNVPRDFRSRIREGSIFEKYLPNFEYYLVPLRDYSNEMLMEKKDEISLVMMINKLQTAEDIVNFRQLPGKEIEEILKDSPEHLVNIIANVLRAFLLKMNVPVPETERLTDKVREKKMGELFENMEKMDIQAERRNTALEKQRADEANVRANEAEKQAAEERNRAEKEKKRADIAEENSIKLLVELCQDLGASMDAAMQSLRDKKDMTMEEAQKKVEIYWKEPTDIPEKKNSPDG